MQSLYSLPAPDIHETHTLRFHLCLSNTCSGWSSGVQDQERIRHYSWGAAGLMGRWMDEYGRCRNKDVNRLPGQLSPGGWEMLLGDDISLGPERWVWTHQVKEEWATCSFQVAGNPAKARKEGRWCEGGRHMLGQLEAQCVQNMMHGCMGTTAGNESRAVRWGICRGTLWHQ